MKDGKKKGGHPPSAPRRNSRKREIAAGKPGEFPRPSGERAAIVLAAGQGKRMKSKRAKVLHPLAGVPMLFYVLDLVKRLEIQRTFVIIGHRAEQVSEAVSSSGVTCLLQDPPLGTGHAVLQAKKALEDFSGSVLILSGDTPLLRPETVQRLWEVHQKERATMTLLTTRLANPYGYGRILRKKNGAIARIVEEKDATPAERSIQEINTGVYIIEAPFLFDGLGEVRPNNQQKEYYLTDLIGIAARRGERLAGAEADPDEVIGVNSRADLATAEGTLRKRIAARWMAEGVTILDPARVRIDASVEVGRDVVIHPGVALEGNTKIGEDCVLHACRIESSRLGERVVVKDYSVIEKSEIDADASIGPFAHLRPGTVLRKGAKVGNFVEIKKSELGEGSKANHLSYLGDAVVGKGVNIGAGTITCNYDGEKKYQTIIEDEVFIGSDTQLVAPVRVGAGALIAAGSTITRDVPPEALAISRVRQENKEGWVRKRKTKKT
ncbi:MAG: bifunctional UDP-N-acetylglucosamine diphosphorylase/glucosamine-1-phosphate N-acetyltransferase GlmU [Candidatus Manganitrophus sp. SB1]|nr:bifunctional UDP-N-acetylglucosamine diphosphorylase/glucosamine-1-phosphate N-acetyltransferase GlmU [Candidatus Manganitrophus morganii]